MIKKNLSPNTLSTWSYNKKLRVTKYHQQIPAKVGVCIIWFVINLVATKMLMLSKNMGSIPILFHKPGVRIKCGVYLRSESNTMRTVNWIAISKCIWPHFAKSCLYFATAKHHSKSYFEIWDNRNGTIVTYYIQFWDSQLKILARKSS